CSYLQQVHYPALLEVRSRINKMSNKSATILANIYVEGVEEPVSTSKGVMVWFDMVKQQSAAIPEAIRAKIENFEARLEK
ncbi:MAG: acyl-CoA thioesterase, partial [Cycloclasticus sp.]